MSASSLAHAIADSIQRFGHFQEPGDTVRSIASLHDSFSNPAGLCCIIANPPMRESMRGTGRFSRDDREAFLRALKDKIGPEFDNFVGPVEWSNNTPTAEVVATLRSI